MSPKLLLLAVLALPAAGLAAPPARGTNLAEAVREMQTPRLGERLRRRAEVLEAVERLERGLAGGVESAPGSSPVLVARASER